MNFMSSFRAMALGSAEAETTAASATASRSGFGNFPVIREMAILFGFVMQGIFIVLSKMNIYSVAAYIIIFTVITRLLLFPLQVKQQKTMKLQNYVQPELMALQKKYAGRRDQASMMAMQEENRAINEKYGISMMSGCITSMIQIPIMFALYPVIYDLPGYVPQIAKIQAENPDLFSRMYTFLGLNLLENPSFSKPLTLLIPVLAGVTQFVSTKLLMSKTSSASKDNPMASSMNTMMYTMPLVSVFFCYSFPMFIGLYWIVQSLVMVVQQLIINHFMKDVTVESLIEKNLEKRNKKRARRGEPPINDKARVSTRNIGSYDGGSKAAGSGSTSGMSAEERERKVREATEYYGRQAAAGSLTAKANMVRAYDERKKYKK